MVVPMSNGRSLLVKPFKRYLQQLCRPFLFYGRAVLAVRVIPMSNRFLTFPLYRQRISKSWSRPLVNTCILLRSPATDILIRWLQP